MSAAPLPVTVIIPAYNREDLLPRALAGVNGQRRRAAEVIVVDDGSADASGEVAAALGARVIRHPENRGLRAARNTGVEAATQPWLAFLDSDDEWLPHHLETLWPLAEQGHVVVGGTTVRCFPDPERDTIDGPARDAVEVVRSPARLLFPGNAFIISATMARTDLVRAVGGFRAFYGVEDYDLWLRLLEHGTGAVSPIATGLYHVHDQQMSAAVGRMQQSVADVIGAHADRPWSTRAIRDRAAGSAAWNNVRSAVKRRRPLEAMRLIAWLAARPQRGYGAYASASYRRRLQRRGARIARDGGPTVALVAPTPARRAAVEEAAPGRTVREAAGAGGLLRMLRRPPGIAVVRGRTTALALRAVGVPAVRDASTLRRALAEWPAT
jgi:glycosyltransferase involved in cell wall biosynthesis